jgi:hypothetical protein
VGRVVVDDTVPESVPESVSVSESVPETKPRSEIIAEKLEDIKKLQKKRDALMAELDISLSIEKLWHDAFKNGSVRSKIRGNIFNIADMELVFNNGEEEKVFKFTELPTTLLMKQLDVIQETVDIQQQQVFIRQVQRLLRAVNKPIREKRENLSDV